jgi:hypothetical protein
VDRRLGLIVELGLDGGSVRGLARDARRRELPFVGWLGPMGAVDRPRARAAEPPRPQGKP